jgi:hypothetical protein
VKPDAVKTGDMVRHATHPDDFPGLGIVYEAKLHYDNKYRTLYSVYWFEDKHRDRHNINQIKKAV